MGQANNFAARAFDPLRILDPAAQQLVPEIKQLLSELLFLQDQFVHRQIPYLLEFH